MSSAAPPTGHGGHGAAGHEAHHPVSFYLAIALFLTILTAIEVGPLFGWYHLPPEVLIGLSAIKFFTVVAFFMHLWDDAGVFARLFVAPMLGATSMVIVLMTLFHTFSPSPSKDLLPVQERYHENWNQKCSSWLYSNHGHRLYCASPPIEDARIQEYLGKPKASATPTVDLAAMSAADRHAWLMKTGGTIYAGNCAACHQATGLGLPGAFPPLAKSDFYGDPKKHAGIVIKGLTGEITVNGNKFNGAMPAQGASYSDQELAAVMTYERNSWGNNDGDVSEADVKSAR